MPLYTRQSRATATPLGLSTGPNSPNRSPQSRLRYIAHQTKLRELELEHERTFESSDLTNAALDDSDSETDSHPSTVTDISTAFVKRKLLGQYSCRKLSDSSDSSNSNSILSESISTVSYSLENPLDEEPDVPKEVYNFNVEGTGAITCIMSLHDNQAMIFRANDKVVHVYQRNGHRKDSTAIGYCIESARIRHDGMAVILPPKSQSLLRGTTSALSKPTPFISFELEIGGMCCTSRYETLVTTKPVERSQKKKPQTRASPSVLRLSRTGERIWEIKTKGDDPFFKPTKIACNVNGDICVIDFQPDKSLLVILTPDGKEKHRYYGIKCDKLTRAFDPKDVCCDKSELIYIADFHNSAVHVLDKNGVFRYFLCTKQDGIFYPTAIAVDAGGFIWVGTSTGRIFVYKPSS